MFHLKPALLHVEIKKGFLITRAQKCLDSQGSHFQHLLKSVQKLSKTKSFLDFDVEAGRF
jgi:hypothetical protein